MSLTKITEADLVNKGVVGLPDTPALSTMEMQEKFDEIALDVIVPKHNELVDELEDLGVESKVGSDTITNIRTNADMAIEVSTDGGETYVGTASSGHRIEDGNGYIYPNRSRLQFSSNVTITDNPEGNATFLSVANGEKGDKGDAATIAIGTVESGAVPAVTNTGSNTDAIFNFTFPKGDAGSAATVQVGTVTSGANASVTNRGTSSSAILDFTLPKGDQGDPGTGLTILASYATLADLQSAHPTGQRGDAYYIEANEHVYIWDTDNLSWEDIGAIKGAKGDTGNAATITVGTVTTGATASVVNSGTTSAAVFDFVLQKGDKGDTGNTGTIAVGSVTSGTTASVTNSGTSTAAVFDFVLPKGDKGDKGDPGNPILPHFKITSDHGSTVTVVKGQIQVAAVETSSGMYEADVPEYGTYTVSSVYSGQTTTTTVDVDTVKVYTANVSIPMGTITVTYPVGATCTCVGQGESYTATTNPYAFTVYHTGTYVITASKDGDTESKNVTITTQGQTESITIDLIPNGSTVTPTDDVQTWLKCANIKDKAYTTLTEVLADSITFNALLGDSNACAYMARCEKLANPALVPAMTSATTPSGEVSASSTLSSSYAPYMAFNPSETNGWSPNNATGDYIIYEFPSATKVSVIEGSAAKNHGSSTTRTATYHLSASNDGTTYTDLNTDLTVNLDVIVTPKVRATVANPGSYKYYKLTVTAGDAQVNGGVKLQFYAADVTLTENQYAMNLIGQYDVCCDALLGNSTWASAIGSSTYMEYVLNTKVPTMTSNTTPSGKCSATTIWSEGYDAYKAFDNNASTYWNPSNSDAYGTARVGYTFETSVKVAKLYFKHNSYTTAISVIGSNDEFATHDVVEDNLSVSTDGSYTISSDNAYTSWGIILKTGTAEFSANEIYTLQFYGHATQTDKIHGANEEVAYYLDGGTQTPISNPSTLDAGTYTFGSTIAKNPDNLSNDYTKSIRITPNTVEVVLRPDNALYWWGYVGNLETMNTANGWGITSGYSYVAPTHNKNHVLISAGNNQASGIGTKASTNATKVYSVNEGVTLVGSKYGNLSTLTSKSLVSTAYNRYTEMTSSSITKYSIDLTGASQNVYIVEDILSGRSTKCYALWYE